MKKTLTAILALTLAFGFTAGASAAEWMTDFEAAKKKSDETGKPILANFSGSDWCGWCIKLDNEVFGTKAFQDNAADDYVLFLADYPREKEQPEAVKTQNKALLEKYGVRGFPTVLLMDAKGEVLGRTGYQAGGPEKYAVHLASLHGEPAQAEMAGQGKGKGKQACGADAACDAKGKQACDADASCDAEAKKACDAKGKQACDTEGKQKAKAKAKGSCCPE